MQTPFISAGASKHASVKKRQGLCPASTKDVAHQVAPRLVPRLVLRIKPTTVVAARENKAAVQIAAQALSDLNDDPHSLTRSLIVDLVRVKDLLVAAAKANDSATVRLQWEELPVLLRSIKDACRLMCHGETIHLRYRIIAKVNADFLACYAATAKFTPEVFVVNVSDDRPLKKRNVTQ